MSILLEDNKEEEILKKSDITYEYIAGVFDADGDICIIGDKSRIRIFLRFTNANLNLLKCINNKFNNIGIYKVSKQSILDPNKNISYKLEFTGKKAITVIPELYKFSLHDKKKKRMKMVLDNLEIFYNNGKPYTPEQKKLQKEILEQSRKMIFRGPGAYPAENQLLKDRKKTIFNYTNDFEKIGLVPYKVEELT